ncbi:MAG: PEGA domain-containing protein [Sandaracinus sp.]
MSALRFVLFACVFVLVAPTGPASAQTDPRSEASTHFQRGTDLFNEGNFDAALAEFQRAYDLAPAAPVLYNLARVHGALGHPVEAAHAYERYLAEGGSAIPSGRRAEVEQALETQRQRIGRVRVTVNVEGAIVSIDGADVATTPLASPIEVAGGTHAIGVRAPGYEGITREISVAGTVEVALAVELRREVEERGTLRIASTLPGVRVLVDGAEVGTTPLASTLPIAVGDHDVVAERAGYLTDSRRVHVADGAIVDVSLVLAPDPSAPAETMGTLDVALPDAPAILRLDDSLLASAESPVRIGPHRLSVEVTDRQPWSGDVEIRAGERFEVTPELVWLPDERATRVGAAHATRDAGIGLAIAAAALLVGGLPTLVWNETEIARTDARVLEIDRAYRTLDCAGNFDPMTCTPLRDEAAAIDRTRPIQDGLRVFGIAASVLGAVLGTVGIVLWIEAPSDADVDAAAHAHLELRPDGLALVF